MAACLALLAGPGAAQPERPAIEGVEEALRQRAGQDLPAGYTVVATGVFLADRWHILTNAHNVMRCRKISVLNTQMAATDATLIALDTRRDMAILRSAEAGVVGLSLAATPSPPDGKRFHIGYDGLPGPEAEVTVNQTKGESDPMNRTGLAGLSIQIGNGQSGSTVVDEKGHLESLVIGRFTTSGKGVVATHDVISAFLNYAGLHTGTGQSDQTADVDYLQSASGALVAVECTQ